jgi:hypothetical protein
MFNSIKSRIWLDNWNTIPNKWNLGCSSEDMEWIWYKFNGSKHFAYVHNNTTRYLSFSNFTFSERDIGEWNYTFFKSKNIDGFFGWFSEI